MHNDDSLESADTRADSKAIASPAILSRRAALSGAAALAGLATSLRANQGSASEPGQVAHALQATDTNHSGDTNQTPGAKQAANAQHAIDSQHPAGTKATIIASRDSSIVETAFDPEAPKISANVPMIVGTNLNEFVHNINKPDGEAMTEVQMSALVEGIYADRTPQVIKAFRERTPNAKPFDIWSRIAAAPIRAAAIEQCTRKAAQRAAPAYLYWFVWQTPILDGRPHAFHCAELPFVFNNAERCEAPDAIEQAAIAPKT